jgi:hypothetical protein
MHYEYCSFKVAALAYYSFQDFEHTPLSVDSKFMKDPFQVHGSSNPSIIAISLLACSTFVPLRVLVVQVEDSSNLHSLYTFSITD